MRGSGVILRCSIFALQCSMMALASGCYAPTPPAGAYSCTAGGACPDGQHCTCGQCVAADSEAACVLGAVAMPPACADWPAGQNKPDKCVHEHEPFAVKVSAFGSDGKTLAGGFHGGLTVTSSWGDAALVAGQPISFAGGEATVQVTLNRETIGASGARISFHAGTAVGTTGRVSVVPPRWSVDAAEALAPGSWADLSVAEPAVVVGAPGDWRMYYTGITKASALKFTVGLGVATSKDGKAWTHGQTPLLAAPIGDWAKKSISDPAPFRGAGGTWNLIFKGNNPDPNIMLLDGPGDLGLATSSDGLGNFQLGGANPVVRHGACNFCQTGIQFPSVTPSVGGAPGEYDLYFVTSRNALGAPLIGHGTSLDWGATWDLDPVPAYAGNEQLLLAPRVVIEGSVYKMLYAYTLAKFTNADPCDGDVVVGIGYATSSDGVYWIPSPSNGAAGAIPPTAVTWAQTKVLVPGSPLLVDSADASKGLVMWFTLYQKVDFGALGKLCIPSGVGRATRN